MNMRLFTLSIITSFSTIGLSLSTKANSHQYIEPPMVNIPEGSVFIGAMNSQDSQPIHQVTLPPFQIGKYSVTVAEFAKFAKATNFQRPATCNDHIDEKGLRGPTFKGTGRWDKHKYSFSKYQAVTCISWQDANDYAEWLSEQTGKNYRLPTEQEWEYATKANTTSRFFWGDDLKLTQACHYGNFADHTGEYVNNKSYGLSNIGHVGNVNCDDGEAYNTIVGLYRPNPFGLYDMVGNTSDYLSSCYSAEGYQIQKPIESCEFISHRGGTWHYPAQPHSTRGRYKKEGWNVGSGTGFRLALDGHQTSMHASTKKFEAGLIRAQKEHTNKRQQLLPKPKNLQLVTHDFDSQLLRWEPSSDVRVTHYNVYRSNSKYSQFYGGYFKKHFTNIATTDSDTTQFAVSPNDTTSYLIIASTPNLESLSSNTVTYSAPSGIQKIPGKLFVNNAVSLTNINMYREKPKNGKPEVHYLSKTNISSEQKTVSLEFNVSVEQSGWYKLNYLGRSLFPQKQFLQLWQDNKLLSTIDYSPKRDDKSSSHHKVFLKQGKQSIQFTALRKGFDRWSLDWISFEYLQTPNTND